MIEKIIVSLLLITVVLDEYIFKWYNIGMDGVKAYISGYNSNAGFQFYDRKG